MDFQLDMMKTKVRLTGLHVQSTWDLDDVVIVEYTMKGNRAGDDREVEFPCVDIYWFEGERVKEWHVFPMYVDFAEGGSRHGVRDTTPEA